jgi:hypothetical protein
MRPSRAERLCCDACRRLAKPGEVFAVKSGTLCETCVTRACILYVKSTGWVNETECAIVPRGGDAHG